MRLHLKRIAQVLGFFIIVIISFAQLKNYLKITRSRMSDSNSVFFFRRRGEYPNYIYKLPNDREYTNVDERKHSDHELRNFSEHKILTKLNKKFKQSSIISTSNTTTSIGNIKTRVFSNSFSNGVVYERDTRRLFNIDKPTSLSRKNKSKLVQEKQVDTAAMKGTGLKILAYDKINHEDAIVLNSTKEQINSSSEETGRVGLRSQEPKNKSKAQSTDRSKTKSKAQSTDRIKTKSKSRLTDRSNHKRDALRDDQGETLSIPGRLEEHKIPITVPFRKHPGSDSKREGNENSIYQGARSTPKPSVAIYEHTQVTTTVHTPAQSTVSNGAMEHTQSTSTPPGDQGARSTPKPSVATYEHTQVTTTVHTPAQSPVSNGAMEHTQSTSTPPGHSKKLVPPAEPGFQLVNDNMTYVYTGHYDDSESPAVVKVISLAPRYLKYNFTCTVHYQDNTVVDVPGYFTFVYASCVALTDRHIYRNGFIKCPVHRKRGRPDFLFIQKQGIEFPKTVVAIRGKSSSRNIITRCNQPFIQNYSNVLQLVWNMELLQLYGVNKSIFYLDSQSEKIVDMLKSYEKDGVVELRYIGISQPNRFVTRFMTFRRNWAQFAANTDCLLSQVNTSKYVLFIDLDEVVVPRKHTNVVDLADDLFHTRKHNHEHTGSLLFKNVYFPSYMEKTKVDYPQKDLALQYNIEPLLHTTRMKTSDVSIAPKSLIRPETVNVMCVHQVFSYKPGWYRQIVHEDMATLHHYRGAINGYMYPPQTEDNFMLNVSSQLIPAVKRRLKKAGMEP